MQLTKSQRRRVGGVVCRLPIRKLLQSVPDHDGELAPQRHSCMLLPVFVHAVHRTKPSRRSAQPLCHLQLFRLWVGIPIGLPPAIIMQLARQGHQHQELVLQHQAFGLRQWFANVSFQGSTTVLALNARHARLATARVRGLAFLRWTLVLPRQHAWQQAVYQQHAASV